MMSRNEDILNAIIEGIDVSQLPDPKSREEALLMGVLDKLNNIEIDPEEIAQAVSDWLDDHPEATTTVEDGSITKAKLDVNLQGVVDDVGELKTEIGELDNILEYRHPQILSDNDWTIGSVAFNNGNLNPSDNGERAWTNDFLSDDTKDITFNSDTNRIMFFVYSRDGVYQSYTSWQDTSPYYAFDFENHKYRLIVRKNPDNQNITASEANSAVTINLITVNGNVSEVADSLKRVRIKGSSVTIDDAVAGKVMSCSGNDSIVVSGYNLCTFKNLYGVGVADGWFGDTIPAGTYTVTAECITNNPNVEYVTVFLGGFKKRLTCDGSRNSFTVDITRTVDAKLTVYADNQTETLTDYNIYVSNIVISLGSSARQYEPHIESKTYNIGELSNIMLTEYTNIIESQSEFDITYAKRNTYINTIADNRNIPKKYVTPEEFGAAGDGNADDAIAINGCISYAISKELPVRGYGVYKISLPVDIIGSRANVYLNKVNYLGSDSAIIYQGSRSTIQINNIVSSGNGILIKAETEHSLYNSFEFATIDAQKDGVLVSAGYNCYSNSIKFQVIWAGSQYSCIHFTRDTSIGSALLSEWHIKGGYLSRGLWGIRGELTTATFIDAYTENLGSDNIGGAIWSESGAFPSIIYVRSGEITLHNTVMKVSGTIQIGATMQSQINRFTCSLNSIDISELNIPQSSHMNTDNMQQLTDIQVQREKASSILLTKHLIFWGNRFQFPQHIYRTLSVTEDLDMTDQYYNGIIPQKFVADNVIADINLHPTYAANCLDTITVEQKNGGEIDLYDYIGNLIFDGSAQGNGMFKLTAYVADNSSLSYDMSNQLWDVQKII